MLNRLPSELSGGQQQRTAGARAGEGRRPVLLDEPLANLDYKLREKRDELPKLFNDAGATVVYATSEPLEALMLGGYTATHQGRVVSSAKPRLSPAIPAERAGFPIPRLSPISKNAARSLT